LNLSRKYDAVISLFLACSLTITLKLSAQHVCGSFFLPACLPTCLIAGHPANWHSNLHIILSSCQPASLPACLPTCSLAGHPAYWHLNLHTCQAAYLPAWPPTPLRIILLIGI
jgi:hypothetical protein